MSRVAITVGRFQSYRIHSGYEFFFDKMATIGYDKLIVFIGVPTIGLSKKNPLDFIQREAMMREFLESACETPFIIIPVPDNQSDLEWSKNLDKLIASATSYGDDITLYYSREGFGPRYSGRFKKTELDTSVNYSSTQDRSEIKAIPKLTQDFRAGVIYTTQNVFNHARAVVDIAVVKREANETYLLMGRKECENGFRLIGGFVDPSDETMEQTVRRELFEETGLTIEGSVKYISSHKVLDWRFRDITEYSLMTSLFLVEYSFGKPIASDDIVEVKWVKRDEALAQTISTHQKLVSVILSHLYDTKK